MVQMDKSQAFATATSSIGRSVPRDPSVVRSTNYMRCASQEAWFVLVGVWSDRILVKPVVALVCPKPGNTNSHESHPSRWA